MKNILITSLLGLSLILTACQTDAPSVTTAAAGTGTANTTITSGTTQPTATGAQTSSMAEPRRYNKKDLTFATYGDLITFDMDQLLALWKSEFPTAGIISVEFDFADIVWVYTISGMDGSKELSMRVDAVTGKILSREEANDDDDDKIIDFMSIISLKDALEIAQAETSPDTIIEEWELNYDLFNIDSIWFEFDLENPDLDLGVNAVDRTVKK